MKYAILELSYACNVACKFCYNAWRSPARERYPTSRVLPKSSFFSIVDKLKTWGVNDLGFSGGEPLLNPDIFEIAEYAKENGFQNTLLTNGMLVEEHAKEIADNFSLVQISLHGTEHVHDDLTETSGSFNRALMGRTALMEYDVAVSSVVVVNRKNLGVLEDTIALAAGLDMNSVLVTRFLPSGKGLESAKELSLNGRELVDTLDKLEKSSEEHGIHVFVGTSTPPCLEGLREYKFLLKEGCMAGKDIHCAIDPSGGLRVCNLSPTVLGNCLESDPKRLYDDSEYVKGFAELRYTPDMCKGCSVLDECKGGCREAAHVLFGSLTAADPLFVLNNTS
jgi:radical SAM protein with 4Fe4S-binding SPASM domain